MVAFPPSPQRVPTLAALRAQIERLEGRGAPGGASPEPSVPTGWPSIDAALPGGLPRGLVTEWFGVGEGPEGKGRERGAAKAPPSRGPWTPPLSLLVHVAHQVVTRSGGPAGERTGPVLWIGRRVWPYGRALVRAGPGGARLLARSLFVAIPGSRTANDGAARDGDAGARLWALDLALRCRAVAAVVADGSGFDMAASRRLQVAAEAGQAFVLLARPPEELDVPSAAGVRFVVTHVPADAPQAGTRGPALAWSLELRRAKGVAGREAAPLEAAPLEAERLEAERGAAEPHVHTRPVHKQRARALQGPAVVLVGDAVHGVIERGAELGFGAGRAADLAGRRVSDPVVVPADVLDRPRAATARADVAHDVLPLPNGGVPVPQGAGPRRRTRTRR